jgi:hypothetical protein
MLFNLPLILAYLAGLLFEDIGYWNLMIYIIALLAHTYCLEKSIENKSY